MKNLMARVEKIKQNYKKKKIHKMPPSEYFYKTKEDNKKWVVENNKGIDIDDIYIPDPLGCYY